MASGRSESPGSSRGEDVNPLESHEQGYAAPVEVPAPVSPPPRTPAPASRNPSLATSESDDMYLSRGETGVADAPNQIVARPASAPQQEVLFVPLAVSIGDGFKFGCGFFLALVLVMLLGFVVVAALFALTSLFGLNLPITR